nr:hypothetical protein [Halalkalibacterium ligniniphilum]
MKRLIRQIIKWSPIIYPVVKKMINNRKSKSHSQMGNRK